ncbi:cache domain-containing sensor histidine kinase [Paenibacillus sp. CAU 1782]
MRIWKWLWSSVTNSFKLKLIGSLFFIIIVAFGIASLYTYRSNQLLFREELSKQARITNQEALSKLELKVQEMKRISQLLVFKGEIEDMITRYNRYKDNDKFQLYLEMQRIDEMINQLRSEAPYITGLYMLDPDGETAYYRYNTPAINEPNKSSLDRVRLNLAETSGELIWMRMPLPSEIEPDGFRNTIVAARWMINSFQQRYGMLVMSIDESYLAEGLQELTKDGTGMVYLFNRSNELLYANDKSLSEEELKGIREAENSKVIGGELYSRSESLNPPTDSFLLVSSRSMDKIEEQNRRISEHIIIAGLLIAFVACLLIVLTLERLLLPLADLLKGLQRLRSGKFETRIKVGTKDELAYIGESFNAMAEHVEGLIKKVYMTQLSERDAELKALQAQLNPHFLHNFFNEVYWKLQLQGQKDTAALIAAVSEILKHSLMPVHMPTTVEEELRQIRNYVKIQAELFETDFEFGIHADDAALSGGMMRSLLQPLVENVFMHAFRNQLDHKVLQISVREKEGFLCIEIADNGCGMDREQIDQLLYGRESHVGENRRESIGVRNVARRIELLHGDPYRLEIDSKPGHGTIMRLYLPVESANAAEAAAI